MLIKSTRIQSESGPKALINHVFDKAEENEEIRVIYGDRSVVESMMQTARDMNKKYGVRHFTISSFERLTEQQRLEARQLTAQEYGFDLFDCVVVRHTKARENNAGDEQHEHLLVPEIQANGRVLDNRANRLRNEKISRHFEIQNGFRIVPGKWNQAVAKAFTQAGQYDFANQMAEACQIERPGASYSSEKKEELKRKGKSLPAIKTDINNIWKQSDGIKSFIAGMKDNGFRIEQGTKNNKSYIIYDEDNTQIGSVSRILKDVRQNDFFTMMEDYNDGIIRKQEKTAVREPAKKAAGLIKKNKSIDYDEEGYESSECPADGNDAENEDLQRDILGSEESTRGNISDSGTDSEIARGWSEPDRIAPGIIEPDSKKSGRADESTFSHPQLVIASAKIKIHLNQSAKFHNISHVRPLTPEYIQEIKERVKSYGKDDKEYFTGIYKNLKEQNREIYKYNKSIDHDMIALIIDAIMRLLFGVSIRQGKAMPEPITYPRFESPIDKDTFDSMSKQDKKSIVFLTFVKLRASYTKHDNFMKKFDMPDRYPSFQAFLQSFAGDFMTDEIINMYPAQYIKELEKSEHEMDREVAIELRKIMKNESSDYPYAQEDLKMFINSIRGEIENNKIIELENKKINEELSKQMAQFYEAYGENVTPITQEKTIIHNDENIIEIGNHFRR